MYSSPIDWQYAFSGPAPPSPYVVTTTPEYFGGNPTPPPSPFRARATCTVDDYAPCPPTPQYVPLSVEQDQLEWSNALNSETFQSTSSGTREYWSASELDHCTSFADPLTDDTSNDFGDQAQYAASLEPRPDASDLLLYARATYAYPSPVLIMMQRASLDMYGLETQPINPFACGEPLKLFSLTGGRTPLTGLYDCDKQSLEYYAKRPYPSLLRESECFLSYRYSISSIQALQYSLHTEWSSVYPAPIPPVIIRSRDLIGPHSLRRRLDGFAIVMPTEDSIWAIICRRGVDLDYRPVDPSLTVETYVVSKGDAYYFPQHIVASKFAVNVFLEVTDSATRPNPLCEYLGAYVLQSMNQLTINHTTWADIDPEVQRDVFDRAPGCFKGYIHPALGWPRLPYIRLRYYKWDRNIVRLADESADCAIPTAGQEDEDDVSDYSDFETDQYCDCDQDTGSTSSADYPEQKYVSFIDFSPCA